MLSIVGCASMSGIAGASSFSEDEADSTKRECGGGDERRGSVK